MNDSEKEQYLIKKWQLLCSVHKLTKHYTLLAEEYSIKMSAYIQPMKEHRDAYDHLIRANDVYYGHQNEKDFDYVLSQLDKAIGHEYRAFYDTLDYLSIILRENLSESLKYFSYTQIINVYPEYENIKKQLLLLPQEIARHREEKDIGNENRIVIAQKYGKIIDELICCYQKIVENVLSKIEFK